MGEAPGDAPEAGGGEESQTNESTVNECSMTGPGANLEFENNLQVENNGGTDRYSSDEDQKIGEMEAENVL